VTSEKQPRRRRRRRSPAEENVSQSTDGREDPRDEVSTPPSENTPTVSGDIENDGGEFATLGLSPTTLQAVARAGYSQPTPVQAGVIPRAIAGVDVLGQARTGTGKTASFVLPILNY
jgi:superfamily II DNA/RNA helicase